MRAAVVCIGNELLKGFSVNTNLQWISGKLDDLGLEVVLGLEVRDEEEEIGQYLKLAYEKTETVIVTGGLGPTSDDITRQSFIKAFGLEPLYEDKLITLQEDHYGHAYKKMSLIPKGASIIYPTRGSAAGWQINIDNRMFFALPGVPDESMAMFDDFISPYLTEHVIKTRKSCVLRFFDVKETVLEEEISRFTDGFQYGLLPKKGTVDVYFSATGTDEKNAESKFAEAASSLKKTFAKNFLGGRKDTLESEIGNRLKDSGETICAAESLTGGLIAGRLTDIGGSSKYFKGSVTAYTTGIKKSVLGLDDEILEKGVISAETATEMALKARKLFDADYGVSSTGNAGPDAQEGKPVGSCFVAVSTSDKNFVRELDLSGSRLSIKDQAATQALILLMEQL